VLVSYLPASVFPTGQSRVAPPLTPGDPPPSQVAPHGNSGNSTPPNRSSGDPPLFSNVTPKGNGNPRDVPTETSSTTFPLGVGLAMENLENAQSTQNPSGDQPSSQNALYSNFGSGPSPHRSSGDQSSPNEAPEGNGAPYGVPSDTSSTTSSLAVDLSVGVYSHSTLNNSADEFRHILYGYSLRLKQVILMPCVVPDSNQWRTLINRWVTRHGPFLNLFYDPVSVDFSMLEAICLSANVSAIVAPDALNHWGFQTLLTMSILDPVVNLDTWSSQIDTIQKNLLGGINLLFASISDAANSSRRSQQYKQ